MRGPGNLEAVRVLGMITDMTLGVSAKGQFVCGKTVRLLWGL